MSEPHQLLTVADRVMLLVNALNAGDPYPVCRLCIPGGRATWTVVSVDPEDLDRLFGLWESGTRRSEVSYFKLSALSEAVEKVGLRLVRDGLFVPDRPFSRYVLAGQ